MSNNSKILIEATPEELTSKILSGIKPILKELQDQADRPEPYIGVPEAAEIFKVSHQNIRKKCSEKTIPFYQKLQKSPIRFKASELYEWIESGRIKTTEEVRQEARDFVNSKKS
jgi:predicted DNA-binding transcriptional regulator AlpA